MPFSLVTEATLADAVTSICRITSYPIPSDPASSADPKIKQMIAACNAASVELFNLYEWPELTTPGSITVVAAVPNQPEIGLALPVDFFRFIDQTQWNGSQRLPAAGPVSPQGWMGYLVTPVTSVFTLTWQMREGKVWFLNPPPAPGAEFRFMYYSRATVVDDMDPALLKNVASKNGDKFRLDGALIAALARQKWMAWNGFATDSADREFALLYDARVGASKGAPILSAVRRSGVRLINASNLPGTGYGS